MIKAFLSSTSKDLEPYRQRAKEAINGIDGYHCVAMENFGAHIPGVGPLVRIAHRK
jgi:hypothetical protein